MEIGVIGVGSNGDIEPIVVLAKGLAARGHKLDVFLYSVKNRDYTGLNSLEGLTVYQETFDKEGIEGDEDVEFWKKDVDPKTNIFVKRFQHMEKDIIDHSARLCEKSDIVIGSRHTIPLACIAKKYGIPFISLSYEASIIPSSFIPPLGYENEGAENNKKLWEASSKDINDFYSDYVNGFLKALDLPRTDNVRDEVLNSTVLNLISYSKHLFDPPADWEGKHVMCGCLTDYNERDNREIPEGLNVFIQSSAEKPVFITFGTMIECENDVAAFHEMVLSAAKQMNRNIIFQSKWKKEEAGIDGIVYKLDGFVPYEEILPKCALSVHHGGTGTSHLSVIHGCPSLVVAYGLDQDYNALVLHRKGCVAGYLKRIDLDADKLAQAMKTALGHNLQDHVKSVREKMKKEDPVNCALDAIEKIFSPVDLGERDADLLHK